jgi:CHAT domain-containing protein
MQPDRMIRVLAATAVVLVVALVFSWAHPAPIPLGVAQAQVAGRSTDSLVVRIDELRRAARYSEALGVAREVLTLRRSSSVTKPHELADAERLVATLEQVAPLPEEERRDLAEADRLDPEVEAAYSAAEYVAGAQRAQRQIAIRDRVLGHVHQEVAASLANLGALLQAAGDHAGATPPTQEALAIRRTLLGEDHPDVAASLNNLAELLRVQGHYAGAEPLFRRSLAMWRRLLGEEHPYVAIALNNLASVIRLQGHAGAEALYRESLTLQRKAGGDPSLYAITLGNLALCLPAAEAEPLYRESLAAQRSVWGQEHPYVAAALNSVAYTLFYQDRYAAADSLYRQALAMRRKMFGEEHSDIAESLNNLASLAHAEGDDARAVSLWGESLAMWRRLQGEHHPDVLFALINLAGVTQGTGDDARAAQLYEDAASTFEAARLRVGEGVDRATFQRSPYPGLAAARLRLGQFARAWPAAERDLGRALADLLISGEMRKLSAAESSKSDSLARSLGDAQRRLAAFQSEARSDEKGEALRRAEAARTELLDAESAWSTFQQEMAAGHPVTEGQAFALDRVQRALSADQAIVGWLDVECRRKEWASWGYVIRRQGPVQWAGLSTGLDTPFDRAARFREMLASPDLDRFEGEDESRSLYRERIAPLARFLEGVGHLIVLPAGAMLGIPVDALRAEDGALVGSRYTVSYAPSATVWTWLRERSARRTSVPGPGAALFVGDPPFRDDVALAGAPQTKSSVFGSITNVLGEVWKARSLVLRSAMSGSDAALDSLPPLPATRLEVKECSALFVKPTLLLGEDASEQTLVSMAGTRALRQFCVLHFATHALTNDERPEQSALIMSRKELPNAYEAAVAGRRVYDGLVTAEEILREWELDAELVTLSGCETGLGRKVQGEGYVGMAHAFFQAGARSVLVSLWQVEDKSAGLLMRRFYENWTGQYAGERCGKGGGLARAEALREAKIWLQSYRDASGNRLYENPFFWAGFILIGEA